MTKKIFFVLIPLLVGLTAEAARIDITRIIPGTNPNTPVGIVANLYNFGLAIAGVLAFGAIVYGAIKYTVSSGNPSQQSDAKEWITQALWGLLLLAGAYLILNTINPRITKLRVDICTTVCPAGQACLVNDSGVGTCQSL